MKKRFCTVFKIDEQANVTKSESYTNFEDAQTFPIELWPLVELVEVPAFTEAQIRVNGVIWLVMLDRDEEVEA